MKSIFSRTPRTRILIMLGLALAVQLSAGLARAEERHERHEAGRGREVYRSQHWVFDDRHHHGHYYPAIGYALPALPAGHLSINFGNRHLFFSAGAWYEPARSGYLVIRPPVGVVIPVLPPAFTTVWVGGSQYYYANEVYYTAAANGYAVAAPPADVADGSQPYSPPAAPAPQPPAAVVTTQTAGFWYWCESARGYYPYVPECREGWRQVPARPPGTP